jgi:hypothetical protein
MAADQRANTPPEVTADSQGARLFAWRRGFTAMHLIDFGVRLGLFKAFADTPDVTAGHVADRLGLHAPYVDVWCTTADSLELLEANEERRFHLAPFMNDLLANPAHPRYLGGYVRLGTAFATEDYRRAPHESR